MSQVFTNKIKSARFIDTPTNSVIELLYSAEGNSILTQFHLNVDFSNPAFLDFIKEWPLEKIEKQAAAAAQVAKDISNQARKEWENAPGSSINIANVLKTIDKHNTDQAAVFDLKLKILDEMTGTKNKQITLKIRRIKTLKELLGLYYGSI
jgi:hypothetical protein